MTPPMMEAGDPPDNAWPTLIQDLCTIWGPSGREDRVRESLERWISPYVDAMWVDAMGNLIAVREAAPGPLATGRAAPSADGQEPAAPRVMVAAHMDEIGVIVTHVDGAGFLRFGPVGGILTGDLVGTRVTFEDGTVGVIGAEKRQDPGRVPSLDELFIDVGAASKEAVRQRVGDMAVFHHRISWSYGRPIAPNHDDRIGCAILVEVIRRFQPGPNALLALFSCQEEVGTRGAGTAAYAVDPDLAIAVDITGAGDTPEAPPLALRLGDGAAVKVKDGGMIADLGLRRLMVRRAEEAGIPYQLEVLAGGTTDARAIQTVRAGLPAGALSVPTRYAHSPSQIVDLRDVESVTRLVLAVLERPLEGVRLPSRMA